MSPSEQMTSLLCMFFTDIDYKELINWSSKNISIQSINKKDQKRAISCTFDVNCSDEYDFEHVHKMIDRSLYDFQTL